MGLERSALARPDGLRGPTRAGEGTGQVSSTTPSSNDNGRDAAEAAFPVGGAVRYRPDGPLYRVSGYKNEGPGRGHTVTVQDEGGRSRHLRTSKLQAVEVIVWTDSAFALRYPGPVCRACGEPILVGELTNREKYVAVGARYKHAACQDHSGSPVQSKASTDAAIRLLRTTPHEFHPPRESWHGSCRTSELFRVPGLGAFKLLADLFFHFIAHGYIEPWKAESHEQNATVMRIVANAAASYAEAGYFTIVDGIFSPRLVLRTVTRRAGQSWERGRLRCAARTAGHLRDEERGTRKGPTRRQGRDQAALACVRRSRRARAPRN